MFYHALPSASLLSEDRYGKHKFGNYRVQLAPAVENSDIMSEFFVEGAG